MKIPYLIITLISANCLFAQTTSLELFEIVNTADNRTEVDKNLKDYTLLKLKNLPEVLSVLKEQADKPNTIKIPLGDNKHIELDLVQQTIFTADFKITEQGTKKEQLFSFERPLTYIGKVIDHQQSLAGICFFNNRLTGVFAFEGANYNLELLEAVADGDLYILYEEQAVEDGWTFNCNVDNDAHLNPTLLPSTAIRNTKTASTEPVPFYIECDYQMYLEHGSTQNAANFITGLFNVVAGIFNSAGITIQISEIMVWTTADAYDAINANGTTSREVLKRFECQRKDGYGGRIAHLITTNSNFGGSANKGNCDNSPVYTKGIYGVTNADNNYSPDLIISSRSVYVLAHEFGHQFSACHTHDCVWNGNNTPIDCCGAIRGQATCTCNAPLPATPGTIMSYCFSLANGVDLSLGFHPQVISTMNDFVTNCLSPTFTVECQQTSPDNLTAFLLSPTSVRLQTNIEEEYYSWRWRRVDSNTWLKPPEGSSRINHYTLTNLVAGADYEFIVALRCNACDCWGDFTCQPASFNTSNLAGQCPDNQTIIDNPASGYYYAADHLLTQSFKEIKVSSAATFQAGNTITLNPGFHAAIGSNFQAIINDCSNNIQGNILLEERFVIKNEVSPILQKVTMDIYPNPFINQTTLKFHVPKATTVKVDLKNINGQIQRHVQTKDYFNAGTHHLNFQIEQLPVGIYLLQLTTVQEQFIKKVLIIE